MTVWLTDAQFNSLTVLLGIFVTAVCSLIAAYWARGAKRNSEEAKNSAAEAANEVKTNGGMSDPNPNLNDHVKYQTEMAEEQRHALESLLHVALPLVTKVEDIDRRFTEHLDETRPLKDQLGIVLDRLGVMDKVKEDLEAHLKQSKVMDQALAAVFDVVKPDVEIEGMEDN